MSDYVSGDAAEVAKTVALVIKIDDGKGDRVRDTEFAALVLEELRDLARTNLIPLE
jgi:hypothetical protein